MQKIYAVHDFPDMKGRGGLWIRRILASGAIFFAVVLFSGAGIGLASVRIVPNMIAAAGQVQTYLVAEEEEKAYRSAKQETEPRKRMEKLYDFVQKYPKSPLLRPADFNEIQPIVDEYTAYYAALQEPDIEKRATLQIDFLRKFPQSPLIGNIESEYMKMLKASSEDKKFELLDSLAEKWLKLRPNDQEAFALIAEANINLKKFEKAGAYLETLYQTKPSAALAREIAAVYEKAGNTEKLNEWIEKLLKMPELADDYMLRYDLAMQYFRKNDLQKAAEYARQALKSAELAKPKDNAERERLEKAWRTCREIIAGALEEKGNYAEAIAIYRQPVNGHLDPGRYYRIGQILDRQRDIENAMHYYAMAELTGGEDAPKAKERLEVLYKALHNDTLVGIDKVYRRAKEELAGNESKS
jgi:tetratricopeptide (TPR) repeat protein